MSKFVNNQISINDALATEFNLTRPGRYKTNCPNPNHRDSDASFEVYGEDKGGYCFGCGKSYWPLDIIMFARGLTYYEALAIAESEYGVELPRKDGVLKEETKADVSKYQKLKGVSIKSKKQLHNLCVALTAIADENDEGYKKYCEMKGLSND